MEQNDKGKKIELSSILDNLPNMVFIKDAEDLSFVSINKAGEKLLGLSLDTVIGHDVYDLFSKKQADFCAEQDRKVLRFDQSEINEQHAFETPSGIRTLQTRKVLIKNKEGNAEYILGVCEDVTEQSKAEAFAKLSADILEMIATGEKTSAIYNAIALMYEARHPGMRCSMLELEGNKLLHGGAPSLPQEYCDAIHGLENGPEVGSCGSSTFTGKRVLVENIETDLRWKDIKGTALPHGMRCCWSEPIKSSSDKVLGAFGMYYDYPALPDKEELGDMISAARLAGIVMERDHDQKRILQLAYNDELTGLASRAHFYQHIEELIKTSKRYGRQFSLLYIDLDNFKEINDSFGHDVGDLTLKEVAKRISDASREADFVARLSGDEFSILVEDVSDNVAASIVAQRCLDLVASSIVISGRKQNPSCSIGIAHYPDDGEDVTSLLKASDTALYFAKEKGKNCYAFYRTELTQKAELRCQFENYLKEAINKKELSLNYQPQIDIKTNQVIGVEALARWQHKIIGEVSPTDFIAVAEQIGVFDQLAKWALETACMQAVQWKKSGLPLLRIAVNISPAQFLDKNFVALVEKVLDETGMEPSYLMLEITESAVQTDEGNILVVQGLKGLGVQLALDDFGTGYSSFASLKHLKVDCLKIDKYFIDDLLVDKKSRFLVSSMIDMAHALGHCIIAEGVEDLEQLEILKELGCDSVQGFLFSQAVSPKEIVTFLNDNFKA